MNRAGVIEQVAPLRGILTRAATTHAGVVRAAAPIRGVVARASTAHVGRNPFPALLRGVAVRGATAHAGAVRLLPGMQGVRNKMLALGEWGDDEQHRILLAYSYQRLAWVLARTAGVNEDAVQIPAPIPVSGDEVLVVGAWQAGRLGISINGAPFTFVPASFVPSLSSMFVNVGADLEGGSSPGVHYKWAVFGSDVPVDADAAALEALGDTVPDYPSSRALVWDGSSYVLSGDPALALVPVEMVQDTKRVSRFNLPQAGLLAKATLYLDGLGGGSGPAQVCRAILYDADSAFVAMSEEVSIPAGTAPGWADFSFDAAGPVSLPAADFYLGLHVGGYSNIIRMLGSGPYGMGGKWNPDTYSDGPSAVFGAATTLTDDYASYITTFAAFVPPSVSEVEDIYLARLPFGDSQRALTAGGPESSPRIANVGWHDTFTDPESGAVALVREGSGFENLLGERIRVSTQDVVVPRSVVAYVHNTAGEEAFDWDVSLPRHLFAQIALLAEHSVTCSVEVVV